MEKQIAELLIELHKALVDKLGSQPKISPMLTISSSGRCTINIYDSESYNSESIYDESINGCIEKAMAFVADMPTQEARAMNDYLAMLAKAVDHAKANNLPDEYIDPARVAIQAMTDNLLTSQVNQ